MQKAIQDKTRHQFAATTLSAEEKQQRKRVRSVQNAEEVATRDALNLWMMTISSSIRESIKKNKTTHEIEQDAVQSGMLTLKRYGVELIREQLTTGELQKSAILKIEHD